MADELTTLRTVLDDIARRRSSLRRRRGWITGAAIAGLALLAVRLTTWLLAPTGEVLLGLAAVGLGTALAAIVVAVRGTREAFTSRQLARLLEERHGGLDDVVVSAVDYADRPDHQPGMAARLSAAALRALGPAPADAVVAPDELQQSGRRALGSTAVLVVALVLAVAPLWRALDVFVAYVAPSRVDLSVEPGNVRVRAGRPVTIRARIAGGTALTPALVVGTGAGATPRPMTPTADGGFAITLPEVTATFGYHVMAGARHSDAFTVTVVHPARVERIDLDYAYPKALGLAPRHEDDGGDIYAPEGTRVALTITADRPVGASALVLADGARLNLGVDGRTATGVLDVNADGSYRIAFRDDDGVEMPDDTEYYIRTLLDRPPDVRIVRPAGDRQVTPLEEVTIEARADDDFGVQAFDLILQKPGQPEVVVPLAAGARGLTVNGAHTLYLEDLEVAPGDVVGYYVRARDLGRGKPPSESRSDIYFLEIKAFDDEFVAAQSQALAAGGQSQGVQDLAAAQKELVVATWKIDSRGRRARAAGSASDIQALADAQRALEQRAAKEAGAQLQASGAASGGSRRRRGPANLSTVSDDPLGLAIEAMRRAVGELDKRQTGTALPHEMEALNQLLRAETDVKRRQIARQQAGGGGNGNRDTPDLSALFDQELRKQQQTNYETPAGSETRQDAAPEDDPLARLRELARRQEAASREQQDLARTREAMNDEALKRRLERLTREQEEIRRELEQLAKQMPERQAPSNQRAESSQSSQSPQSSSSRQPGEPPQPGGSPSSGSGQSQGQSRGESGAGAPDERQAMRDAVSEMRQASSGLRDQDAARASQNAERALERMRRAEEALRGSTDDDLRRRLGDLQLEARQLAEAQRRLSAEAGRESSGAPGTPGAARNRQMAAEQSRLADRADRLRDRMRALAQQARPGDGRSALDQAGRELNTGRAPELMRDAAKSLERPGAAGAQGEAAERQAGATPPSTTGRTAPTAGAESSPSGAASASAASRTTTPAGDAARLGGEAARALDRVAERLDARRSADGASSTRLSDDLTRTRDLRDRLEAVERSLEALRERGAEAREAAGGREAGQPGQPRDGRPQAAGEARGTTREGEIARLQQQLADDMRQARAEVDALGRTSPEMRGPSTPETWQPSVSAPGTEAFKQDFARWESLKRNLLLALEKVEQGLADDLRQQETRDRLNAGASDAVPDDYRKLVDRYYRSLAVPRRPER